MLCLLHASLKNKIIKKLLDIVLLYYLDVDRKSFSNVKVKYDLDLWPTFENE